MRTSLNTSKLDEAASQCDQVLTYLCNNQKSVFESSVRLFPLNFPAQQDPVALYEEPDTIALQLEEELVSLDSFIAD